MTWILQPAVEDVWEHRTCTDLNPACTFDGHVTVTYDRPANWQWWVCPECDTTHNGAIYNDDKDKSDVDD